MRLQMVQGLRRSLGLFFNWVQLQTLAIVLDRLLALIQLHGRLGQDEMGGGFVRLDLDRIQSAEISSLEVAAVHVEVRHVHILGGTLIRTLQLGARRVYAMQNVSAR